jgi:hypothetical protein
LETHADRGGCSRSIPDLSLEIAADLDSDAACSAAVGPWRGADSTAMLAAEAAPAWVRLPSTFPPSDTGQCGTGWDRRGRRGTGRDHALMVCAGSPRWWGRGGDGEDQRGVAGVNCKIAGLCLHRFESCPCHKPLTAGTRSRAGFPQVSLRWTRGGRFRCRWRGDGRSLIGPAHRCRLRGGDGCRCAGRSVNL